ncbi:MAG: hypothetical protein HXX20_02120 [Chloroflexi bacterium]|nr:hypothetical protein [Chloroflexota bacterium]
MASEEIFLQGEFTRYIARLEWRCPDMFCALIISNQLSEKKTDYCEKWAIYRDSDLGETLIAEWVVKETYGVRNYTILTTGQEAEAGRICTFPDHQAALSFNVAMDEAGLELAFERLLK